MIDAIEISNFRCFHQTKISGFKSVNLIGGKNNSGKTALLEAICCVGREDNYEAVIKARYGDLDLKDRMKNLFFDYLIDNEVKIKLHDIEKKEKGFSFSFKNGRIDIINHPFFEISDRGFTYLCSLIFSKNLQLPINLNLSNEFDKADIKGESQIILEALQVIDSSIEEIKTYSSKPNMLYMRRKSEKGFAPLNDFGDALQKVMRYIITIMDLREEDTGVIKCLLIDEIENGLHFTSHQDFWKMLLKLSKAYHVQIFATSHSLEMINAFHQVAYQTDFEQDAMYFEMSRHAKTREIIANPMDMGMLHYEITKNNTFRGE